ncbi:M3 family oligoendopeptidase [Planomicrobium sp. CPCC 101110]|uniref:M3 family oligoendopeptidase n=1 Tax=Planomicrobium sp. CPCC 101110 TaxID=2599619 RepID=UPI0011B40106|nr:M3 family oligoendopeptidase [Planomicrobium sp. CPCC 101110]TWT25907.1 M3 family oligoendopeptidase [Planomicrobium sp. CPCC 101110]
MKPSISRNWDLDALYEGGSTSAALQEKISSLDSEISRLSEALKPATSEAQKMTVMLRDIQYVMSRWLEIEDFSVCIYSQNTADPHAAQLLEQVNTMKSKMKTLHALLNRTLADLDEGKWQELLSQEGIEKIAFSLEERRRKVKDRLQLEIEQAINALSVNGFDGWEQLHNQLFNQLQIPLGQTGQTKEHSIGSALNQALYDKDRKKRTQAAKAITQVCSADEETFAVILNRIAGYRLELYQQRGWDNLLKEALEQNRIQEKSVQSMLAALEECQPLFRDYLQRKKELLNVDDMRWFDLEVPCFETDKKFPYGEAVSIIVSQFRNLSVKLGEFAEKAFQSNWIESENRPGKAEGAFCAALPLAKESRIFLTYRENYFDVITLAHELGHAYHNEILHDEPAFIQEKGTSIEETASIFMENLVLDAAIEKAGSQDEKLALLEMKISSGLLCVSTIPNMFHFEKAFYELRKNRLLSAKEIKELLIQSEKKLYEGLVEEHEVYRWLYIPHIYVTEKAFYNIPYTIGYLFSSGIYAMKKELGDGFMESYDNLLRNSGRMTVEQLGRTYLNRDLTEPDFWRTALEPLKAAIEEFMRLTGQERIQ